MDEPDSRDPEEIAAEARRLRARLVTAGVVLLAGVIAIALLAGGRPVGPGQATYDAGTTDPVRAALPLLEAYVQNERGLGFTRKVTVSVVDTATLAKQAARPISKKPAPATDRTATLDTLGLTPAAGPVIPAGTGYGADGYYSYTTHTIYLRGGVFDAYHRALLVHLLTVALDDQHYGLLAMTQNAAGNGDHLRALDALVDGDATRVELSYVDAQSPADRKAIKALHNYDPPATTYAENAATFTVTAGANFIDALVNKGGNSQVSKAFESPPTSSTQILGPDSYLSGTQPYSVREPNSPGQVLDRGSLGQFGLAMLMTGGKRYRNVSVLAQIQGDAYVTTRSQGKTCVTDSILLPSDVSRDQLLRDMAAAHLSASRLMIDNSLRVQVCR